MLVIDIRDPVRSPHIPIAHVHIAYLQVVIHHHRLSQIVIVQKCAVVPVIIAEKLNGIPGL